MGLSGGCIYQGLYDICPSDPDGRKVISDWDRDWYGGASYTTGKCHRCRRKWSGGKSGIRNRSHTSEDSVLSGRGNRIMTVIRLKKASSKFWRILVVRITIPWYRSISCSKKAVALFAYLSFEEDPNADDAAIVAENTKGLLNGTKHYPVRTDGKKVVYLTFDDGPSTTNTPQVLDILDKYNVKATFFVLGSSIDKNEEAKEILKEQVKRGHAIANHTYSHDYSYLYPNRVMNVDNIISDLEKSENSMKAVLGKDFSTRVIRLPGGYWSWEGRTPMKEAMEQDGYYNVDWNALDKDAEGKPKNADELLQCTKETVEALGPNADSVVLLMHDTYGKEETVKALPRIIEYLQSEGYEFRTIK